MEEGLRVVAIRRAEDWRGMRRLTRGRRAYELRFSDGSSERCSFGELDRVADGRRYPADFWACVNAADQARAEGDADSMFEWPNGRRLPVA